MKLRLLGDIPTTTAIDGRAYELYLQGRYIWEEQRRENYGDAQAKLEQALEIEPDFVPALYELAKVIWTIGNDSQEARNAVRLLVDRMSEVAPDSGYTNAWLGWIAAYWDYDFQQAALHFERAIADDPLTPVSMRRAVSGFLTDIGRGEEGYALARFSAIRDPASVRWASTVAGRARYIGRYKEAAAQLEELFEWQVPTPELRWQYGAILLGLGDAQRALEQFDLIIDAEGTAGYLGRLMALYDLGRVAEFETEFASFKEANPEGWEAIARVLAWTGQNDAAFDYLEKMVEHQGAGTAKYIKYDLYSRLKSDPRYDAFLAQHGASDEDLSHIRFDPPYPPEMRAEIERIVASIQTD